MVLWPEAAEPAPRSRFALSPRAESVLDVVITVTGLIVATLLGVALAVVEAVWAPLRIGGFRVPASLVVALVTNPMLGWFAYTVTKRRLATLLPAAAWCVVWIMAAGRTTEGDMIITEDNWVGLLTLFAGPLAFAVGIYISNMRQHVAPTRATTAKPSPEPPPAGS
ncbi:hypothetical protein GCM10018962_00980 [Dactylosporangium matsuzakiense]|uniref:Uncharacterized protein n=1 Tax=Dactylosporangium matsuzakiense TaxID=53360 RepID=A0A9W6KDD1_9ACTN|nr:hypothetical protein GCM10017581_017560 [Dactylosporangium matsuzakiense]